MSLDFSPEPLPLAFDEYGVVRVNERRITLDNVLIAHNHGSFPHQIAYDYDLDAADVHAILCYYLRHKTEVDEYLEGWEIRNREAQEKIEAKFGTSEDHHARFIRKAIVFDAFRGGATPFDLVQDFPSFELSEIHAVYKDYLSRKRQLDFYLEEISRDDDYLEALSSQVEKICARLESSGNVPAPWQGHLIKVAGKK